MFDTWSINLLTLFIRINYNIFLNRIEELKIHILQILLKNNIFILELR